MTVLGSEMRKFLHGKAPLRGWHSLCLVNGLRRGGNSCLHRSVSSGLFWRKVLTCRREGCKDP